MTPSTATDVVVDPRPLADVGATVVALPVWPGDDESGSWIGPGAAEVDGIGADVYEALERESATGKAGQLVTVPTSGEGPVERVLLVGVGDGSPAMYRRAGAAVARAARGVGRR